MPDEEGVAITEDKAEEEKPRLLGRGDIFGARDIEYEYVSVPEWSKDGVVRVKTLTMDARDDLEASCVDADGNRSMVGMRAKALAMTIVDENGNPVFSIDDAKTLGLKSAIAGERVFDVSYRMAGMGGASLRNAVKKLEQRPERVDQFRLTLALGYPHPDYLMPLLSGPQFTEWQAYGIVEGFRPLESVIRLLLEGLGPKSAPKQSPEDMKAAFTSIFKQFGAKKKGEEAKSEKRKVKKKV